ncbi:MAG: hypothetical protein M0R75_09900, partial [Dehalococcoidia bacterium]|nr:hypothetical protein [Dehalococcoidia bacterium]
MSQRNRLFVLLVAVTLPMFALAALFVVTSVRESRASTERDTVALARAGVLATESFFDGHRRTLSAIALGFRDARRLTEPELRARLIDAAEANPEWDGMSVVGPDGIAIAGSRATSAGADLSERPYLQQMFATGRPVVSDGLRTLREGVPAVLIASPIAFEDGTTGGFVGSVSLSTLASALTQQLTTDARVGLIDRAGQTLVHPDAERVAVLLNVGDRPEVRAAFEGETGFIEAERDGEGTLVAFAPVESLGWAVTVAEDSSAAYAGADAIAWRGMIFVSLAVLAVAIGGWYLGGRLNRSYVEMQAARLAEAEARERAEAVLRSRDEFISIASHELRNPVAAVRGFG